MQRYRLGCLALACAGAWLTSSAALAGRIEPTHEVVISLASRNATGSLGDVHNSSDTTQRIGCSVGPTDELHPLPQTGVCFARDRANNHVECFTRAPSLLKMIRALNGESFLSFDWNVDGTCSGITVHNGSTWQPKR